MDKTELIEDLRKFLEVEVLRERTPELNAETPLIELGILNSLSTSKLLAFLRESHGIHVPPERIVGRNFASLDRIAELALTLREA